MTWDSGLVSLNVNNVNSLSCRLGKMGGMGALVAHKVLVTAHLISFSDITFGIWGSHLASSLSINLFH